MSHRAHQEPTVFAKLFEPVGPIVQVGTFPVEIPSSFIKLYSQITDQKVYFTKDSIGIEYRMITFWSAGTYFVLVTNRFDLTTFEVVMLYGFRWQVELLFKKLLNKKLCPTVL